MSHWWSVAEVQTFLAIVAEPRIQEELKGTLRNEKIYTEVCQRMAAEGFQRTTEQCREKLKKLRSQYRKAKEEYNQDTWKWFDAMDAIYGDRPTNRGSTDGAYSATPILLKIIKDENVPCEDGVKYEAPSSSDQIAASPSVSVSTEPEPEAQSALQRRPVRKRKRVQNMTLVMREMQAADEKVFKRMEERRQEWHEAFLEDAREARRHEADLTRRFMEQTDSFNQAFLGTLGQLVQVLGGRHDPMPPPSQ